MSRGKVIFIDRDGVINKDPGGWTAHNYVTRWRDFHFLRGAKKAIAALTRKNYNIVIISNQAGVSKSFYSADRLWEINSRMLDQIRKAGGRIKKVYYCVHQDSDHCDCRKPNIGLLKKAARELKLNIKGAYFIGDGKVDILAGHRAALETVLVLCGKTDISDTKDWHIQPDHVFNNLLEAVRFILKGEKSEGAGDRRRRDDRQPRLRILR